jgi:ketosteroid isomerase-like protein
MASLVLEVSEGRRAVTLRTRRVLALLPSVLLPLCAAAQDDPDVATLRRLEAELSEALVERDAEALGRLWHDDLIFIGTNGRQFTKAERISGQRIAEGRRDGETNVNDEVAVRVDGDVATVIVTSTWTIPSGATATASRFRALHVWTRSSGEWQLLAAQVAALRN